MIIPFLVYFLTVSVCCSEGGMRTAARFLFSARRSGSGVFFFCSALMVRKLLADGRALNTFALCFFAREKALIEWISPEHAVVGFGVSCCFAGSPPMELVDECIHILVGGRVLDGLRFFGAGFFDLRLNFCGIHGGKGRSSSTMRLIFPASSARTMMSHIPSLSFLSRRAQKGRRIAWLPTKPWQVLRFYGKNLELLTAAQKPLQPDFPARAFLILEYRVEVGGEIFCALTSDLRNHLDALQ
jgi:hypothetical protein